MDLGAFVRGLTLFDLVAMLIVAGFFVLGFAQGPIRRLVGIAIALLILLITANLRAPIGDWLSGYWTQDSQAYCWMIAFGASFGILFVTAVLAAQLYVKPMTVFPAKPLANELLGGALGVFEGIILLGAIVLILDSYFRVAGTQASANELGILRDLFHFYDVSTTAHVYRDELIPAFFWAFGWITPQTLREAFAH